MSNTSRCSVPAALPSSECIPSRGNFSRHSGISSEVLQERTVRVAFPLKKGPLRNLATSSNSEMLHRPASCIYPFLCSLQGKIPSLPSKRGIAVGFPVPPDFSGIREPGAANSGIRRHLPASRHVRMIMDRSFVSRARSKAVDAQRSR